MRISLVAAVLTAAVLPGAHAKRAPERHRLAERVAAPTSADELLLAVRDAVRLGDLDRAAALGRQMAIAAPDHPLLAYAEYWPLAGALRSDPVLTDDESVRGFIARNDGSVVADLARRDWLLVLGKRGDFATFDRVYPTFALNDDAQVSCYALLSRYLAREGQPAGPGAPKPVSDALLRHVEAALAVPRNADGDGCAALGQALADDGWLRPEEVWSWIRLASDANPTNLANLNNAIRRYLSWLPPSAAAPGALGHASPNAAPDAKTMSALLDKPALWLVKSGADPRQRQLVVLALSRMARADPEQTAATFERDWAPRLRPDDRAYVWAQIGAAAAKKQLIEAAEWSRKSLIVQSAAQSSPAQAQSTVPAQPSNPPPAVMASPQPAFSEDVLGWQARAALRAQDWSLVRALIEKMPVAMRRNNDGGWIYWLGRALKFEGKNDEARGQWAAIAAQHDFYGQLATEELGRQITLPVRGSPPTDAELAAVKDLPGFARAFAFYQLDLRAPGNLEWNFTLRGMNDRQLLAAAEWAQRNAVLDRTVNTADRTRGEHDFNLRYISPFRQLMQAKADEAGIDVEWVYGLIRQESRFLMVARSSVGAAGMMQLMPATARFVAKKTGLAGFNPNAINDLDTNLTLGTRYLRMVLDNVDDLPVLATAGYNAGPSRPRAWRATLLRPVEGAIFAETIPFNETRDYVKKVMSNAVYYGLLDGKPESLKRRMGMVAPKGYVETELP